MTTDHINAHEGDEGTGNTADTNEHDATEEAKINTLNTEHKTFKIKQES